MKKRKTRGACSKNKETDKNRDAYEFYFSLGDKRTFEAVAKHTGMAVQTVYTWKKRFNWDKRIKERNDLIAKRVEAKLNTQIVNSKADYRQNVKENLEIMKAMILTVIDPITKKLNVNVKAKNATDVSVLANAIEKLIKLDLLLMGEDTEKETVNININVD